LKEAAEVKVESDNNNDNDGDVVSYASVKGKL
jgi:hypothetical protein